MYRNQGFVTIISLLVMGIILIFSLFLIYISNMEYLILNSSESSTQAYYAAESKLYMILKMEDYYKVLLPRVEEYLKTGRLANHKDKSMKIEERHLLEGDKNGTVKLDFYIESNRRILELSTSSSYNGITNEVISKIYLINNFFEMKTPTVSENSINKDKLEDYIDYMDNLQREIVVPLYDRDIVGVDGSNYERVNIITKLNGKTYAEFFRNDIEVPVKREVIGNKGIFLVAKSNDLKPVKVCILAEEGIDKVTLEGTFYIEGDLQISSNAEVDGILIINNGSITTESLIELNWNGLVLLKDYIGQELEDDYINVHYDEKVIKRCGVHLPGFIDPTIKVIKRK